MPDSPSKSRKQKKQVNFNGTILEEEEEFDFEKFKDLVKTLEKNKTTF
jgi:hypothetical protein